MRSSTTPPVASSQHSVHCAPPGLIRSRSLVRQELTNAAAPGPVTRALPRWETSKTPTASRTAVCSAMTPPPAYSSGISQPPKGPNRAPRAACRSCRGDRRRPGSVAPLMGGNLPAAGPVATIGRGASRRCPQPPDRTGEPVTLPRLSLFDTDPAELDVDAIVIGVYSREGGDLLVGAGAESIAAAFDGRLTATLKLLGSTGAAGEVVKLATLGTITAPLVVAVGDRK